MLAISSSNQFLLLVIEEAHDAPSFFAVAVHTDGSEATVDATTPMLDSCTDDMASMATDRDRRACMVEREAT